MNKYTPKYQIPETNSKRAMAKYSSSNTRNLIPGVRDDSRPRHGRWRVGCCSGSSKVPKTFTLCHLFILLMLQWRLKSFKTIHQLQSITIALNWHRAWPSPHRQNSPQLNLNISPGTPFFALAYYSYSSRRLYKWWLSRAAARMGTELNLREKSYCGDGSHGTGYVFRGYPLGQSFFFRLKRISEALLDNSFWAVSFNSPDPFQWFFAHEIL